ncbi:winged helix-turn-helix transcriptional regulator [Halosimplex rubrum]|uniref:Winged helix-turn-helix transcriptional regulator n=1 Tax=Halosimplex rubrum TaxID=869889 RepID=A0A7D5SXC7_9EURY|nr:winged helix-turn-helix domain-containing protein [Halosimplex rubrum]QLH77251.1 winged helix-turn-helix transcriptional regulator [Halosimplex rubrum]
MVLSTDSRSTGRVSTGADESTATPEAVIEVLADDHARTILRAVRAEPRSARRLSELCDASRPTVYRKLDRLQRAGLVTAEMEHDTDGYHRRRFEAAADLVEFELGDAGFDVTVDPSEPGRDLSR